MTTDSSRPETSSHRDRSTRLVVGGVLLILLGALALLLALVMLASAVFVAQAPEIEGAAPTTQLEPAQTVPGLLVYGGGGAVLLTLGIGSCLRRRWVRPLVQILGWGWLVIGVLTLVMMVRVIPIVQESLPTDADPAAGGVVVGCMGAIFGLFGILAPVGLLLLYSGRDVAATLADHDPEPRWTERVPTPLLGLSLWLGVAAVGTMLSSLYAVLPLGGRIVTGVPAVLVYLVSGGLFAVVAIGLARRSRAAWWLGLATFVAWGAWSAWTLPRTDFEELMRLMGTPPNQPGVPDLAALYQEPWFLAWTVVGWLGLMGYLVFVRRYLEERPASG